MRQLMKYDTAEYKPGLGVKSDFSTFLNHFTEKNTLRYEDFAELWKEMYMPYIFAGRSEYPLKEALLYAYECAIDLFNSTVNIQGKTCAIYILYAVYETQAVHPKMKIRVTVAQFRAFTAFVDQMAKDTHYDFVFVFSRLRMARAFLYVATARPQGKLKYKNSTTKIKDPTPTSLVSTFADVSLDLVDNLAIINEEYYRIKCATTNPGQSTPHASVDLAKPEFIRDITGVLARFDNWRKTGRYKRQARKHRSQGAGGGLTTSESEGDNLSDSDSAAEKEESIGQKRQRLREKGYGDVAQVTRSTRYRRIIAESSQSDGVAGPSGSPEKPKSKDKGKNPIRQRAKKPLPPDQQIKLDQINAYLQLATAPSKKERRKRRRQQRVAKKKLITSKKNKGLSTDDSSSDED